MFKRFKYLEEEFEVCGAPRAALKATVSVSRPLSPLQEVFSGEMDGGNPSLALTPSLVPLSHKAVPSGYAVITHFTALILITANVNMRIININAQNNAVICNYRVALIFPPPLPFLPFFLPPLPPSM